VFHVNFVFFWWFFGEVIVTGFRFSDGWKLSASVDAAVELLQVIPWFSRFL